MTERSQLFADRAPDGPVSTKTAEGRFPTGDRPSAVLRSVRQAVTRMSGAPGATSPSATTSTEANFAVFVMSTGVVSW